jgi:hypothetical protein
MNSECLLALVLSYEKFIFHSKKNSPRVMYHFSLTTLNLLFTFSFMYLTTMCLCVDFFWLILVSISSHTWKRKCMCFAKCVTDLTPQLLETLRALCNMLGPQEFFLFCSSLSNHSSSLPEGRHPLPWKTIIWYSFLFCC